MCSIVKPYVLRCSLMFFFLPLKPTVASFLLDGDDADASMSIYRKPMQITELSFVSEYTN